MNGVSIHKSLCHYNSYSCVFTGYDISSYLLNRKKYVVSYMDINILLCQL